MYLLNVIRIFHHIFINLLKEFILINKIYLIKYIYHLNNIYIYTYIFYNSIILNFIIKIVWIFDIIRKRCICCFVLNISILNLKIIDLNKTSQ